MRLPGIVFLASGHIRLGKEEVVVAIHLMQTNLLHTVNDVVEAAVDFVKALRQYALADAIITQIVPQHLGSVLDHFQLLITSQENVILAIAPLAVTLVPALHDHLAVGAELIRARGQIAVRRPAVVCTRRTAAVGCHEVIIIANLTQTALRAQFTVLDVIQAVFHLEQTVLNQLAIDIEVIICAGQIAMRLPGVVLHVLGNVSVVQEEVIISIDLVQTNLLNAFNKVIQGTINRIKSCTQRLNVDAILIKVAPSLIYMHLRLRTNLMITF